MAKSKDFELENESTMDTDSVINTDSQSEHIKKKRQRRKKNKNDTESLLGDHLVTITMPEIEEKDAHNVTVTFITKQQQ